MKAYRLIGCTILTMLVVSCSTKLKTPDEPIPANWITYTTNDFSLSFPETWEQDDSGLMGMTVQVLSPQASMEDVFRENVNLVVQDMKGQPVKNLDDYTAYSLAQIKTMITGSKVISDERVKRNGHECHRVHFNAEQGAISYAFEQYYLVQDKKAYVLTLTCETDSFAAYSAVGEKIMNTFVLH